MKSSSADFQRRAIDKARILLLAPPDVAPAVPRPAHAPMSTMPTGHVLFLLGMLILIIPIAFALDPLAGAMRGHWFWLLRDLGLATTHLGKAQWVMIAGGLTVIASWVLHRFVLETPRWAPSRLVRCAAYLFACSGSAELLSSLLKGLFGRARPQLFDTAGAYFLTPFTADAPYLSFPSGHATAVGAACTAIALLAPRLRWIVLPIGLWLGFTRVLVGAHYPSDVIVGLIFGGYIALFLSMFFERKNIVDFPR